MTEKTVWQMQLWVPPELKETVVKLCKERRTRIPMLLSAVIERVFENPELLHELLENSQLPKSHQRSQPKDIVAVTEQATEQRLVESCEAPPEGHPVSAPEVAPASNPKEVIRRALERAGTKVATVHPLFKPAAPPKNGPADSKISKVVSIDPTGSRRAAWDQLCEQTKLPGEYLDYDLEMARKRWEERWGEPTDAEVDQMIEAVVLRQDIYSEWRKRYSELKSKLEQAEKGVEGQKGRSLRLAQRKLQSVQRDMEVFKLRTRWKERDMSEQPPWEQPVES